MKRDSQPTEGTRGAAGAQTDRSVEEESFELLNLVGEYLALAFAWRDRTPEARPVELDRLYELRRLIELLLQQSPPSVARTRRTLRVPAELRVRFGRAGTERGSIRELSEWGAAITTSSPLPPGSAIDAEIIRSGHRPSLRVCGRVVWNRPATALAPGEMGIEFDDLDVQEAGGLRDVLEDALLVSISSQILRDAARPAQFQFGVKDQSTASTPDAARLLLRTPWGYCESTVAWVARGQIGVRGLGSALETGFSLELFLPAPHTTNPVAVVGAVEGIVNDVAHVRLDPEAMAALRDALARIPTEAAPPDLDSDLPVEDPGPDGDAS